MANGANSISPSGRRFRVDDGLGLVPAVSSGVFVDDLPFVDDLNAVAEFSCGVDYVLHCSFLLEIQNRRGESEGEKFVGVQEITFSAVSDEADT
jgi:hypothetical protein